MQAFLLLLALLPYPSVASTWPDDRGAVAMNAEMMLGFRDARLCAGRPSDPSIHAVYINSDMLTITVFLLHTNGAVEAFQNMLGERLAIDHCLW